MTDMLKKRSAKEAFTEPKQPLSAFAAAKARAAKLKSTTPNPSQSVLNVAEQNIASGAAEDGASLPTLLSSFPLSSKQNIAEISDNEIENEAAQFSGEEDDDEYLYGESSSSHKTVHYRKLSSLSPYQTCVISNQADRLTLKLQQDETVTFVGEYDLRVITGLVVVYGAVLRPSDKSHRMYAPSTHALPIITAKGGVAEIVIVSTGPSLSGLGKLSPLWGRIWNGQNPKDSEIEEGGTTTRSFALLRTSLDDVLRRAVTPLEVEQDVQILLNKIIAKPSNTSPPVVLISGPKGSGKSTISRYLTNAALTHPKAPSTVFYLDLDPGQPEFLAPGQLSLLQLRFPLLGPPYTHPSPSESSSYRLIRSHTLATTSPKDDTTHYLSCASDLRDRYHRLLQDFPGAPCIINCSGWVQGSAVPVLLELVQRMRPSDIVVLHPMDNAVIANLEAVAPHAAVATLNARAKGAVQSRTSAEMRAMQTMSYFHSSPAVDAAAWDPRPLAEMRSWRVKYTGADAGVAAVISYGEVVDPSFLSQVIEGMVVAVVVVESEDAFGSVPAVSSPTVPGGGDSDAEDVPEWENRIARTPAEGLPYLLPASSGIIPPLDPQFSRCIGLALIRGIDAENQELQLLTPISAAEIREVADPQKGGKIVLVRGKFDSPDWAFLEEVHAGRKGDGERPYVAERDAERGLGGHVWRVRHLPRNFGA